jgi:hypothetical protein
MADEAMDLIARLRNPAWEVGETGPPMRLHVGVTRATMDEAANKIEALEKQLAAKSGMGVAENHPETFNELKK